MLLLWLHDMMISPFKRSVPLKLAIPYMVYMYFPDNICSPAEEGVGLPGYIAERTS